MEWYVVQTQDLHGIFSSLGSPVGNDYHVGENCLASLGEILACLSSEDRSMRNFRRALGITQVIQTDLIPLLIHAKDDIKVMNATIRVLVNLTLPVECLLPLDSLSQTECGRQTISDLNHLLLSAKEAFVEPRSTQCLMQIMRAAIDKGGKLVPEECESIGNCLLLLRNILHIPEKGCRSHGQSHHSPLDNNGSGMMTASSKQNLILWNLFAQNFDKVLLHLMTCSQRAEWEVPMVQLVALTFRDQRMASLLKMLHLWLETSMSSESSEDNESNTSPQSLGSGNSTPVLTSEATSDSSDNGGTATGGGKASQKGDRKSGISSEEERGTYLAASASCKSDSPNNKNQRESQSEVTSHHSNSSNKEEELQSGGDLKTEAEEESRRRGEEAIQEKDKEEEGVKNGRRGDEGEEIKGASGDDGEDCSYGDKDSGIFSQAASPRQPSTRGEKKVHLHPYQRHHHQHHRIHHRYSHHHHCMHPSHHSNSKKDSSATLSSMSSPSKGMANTVSELSDCGYSTQVENQPESLSTSSNEDEGPIAKRSMKPGHQKHHHIMRQNHKVDSNKLVNVNTVHIDKVQKSDLRRKKFVKRPRIRTGNRNVLPHHIPTDDDISNLLKEFTLDFMLQGYGPLVSGLHVKLLSSCSHRAPGIHASKPPPPTPIVTSNPSLMSSNVTIFRSPTPELPPPPIDTSHFFWLITFFLRFSSQLELELDNISMVLSYDILSYLVFEGVGLCEDVALALHHCHSSDLTQCLRRIHLVVTAIREFVQTVESYRKMAMTIPGREGDRTYLLMLQKQMAASRDLRCLFVLLLQHYKPSVMSKQYLLDIVVTNHVLLLFLEGGGDFNEVNSGRTEKIARRRNSLIEEFEMKDHIAHFANGSIVQQYGHLLEAFQENGEFVNDCVFTMLHHIGGEVSCAETLFQPTLLRAFSAMWEADFDMCDDWSDLIEYIIYKFISNPQKGMNHKNVGAMKSPLLSNPLIGNLLLTEDKKDTRSSIDKWTIEELSNLRWFYSLSCKDKNVLGKIVTLYHKKIGVAKSRLEVLNQLLSQEIINPIQYASLKNTELTGDEPDNLNQPYSPTTAVNMAKGCDEIETREAKDSKDVAKIAVSLVEEGLDKVVYWLQDALLQACYVKIHLKMIREGGLNQNSPEFPVMEPVPYHYALMGQPIPIVPWGVEEQCAVIQNTSFVHLLRCLGIQTPREDGIGGIYPRIPTSLTPLNLLDAAKKLGELNPGKMKFDPAEVCQMEKGVDDGEKGRRGEEIESETTLFSSPTQPLEPPLLNPANLIPALSHATVVPFEAGSPLNHLALACKNKCLLKQAESTSETH